MKCEFPEELLKITVKLGMVIFDCNSVFAAITIKANHCLF